MDSSLTYIIILTVLLLRLSLIFSAEVCQDNNCNICSSFYYSNTCTECSIGYFVTNNKVCEMYPSNCQICQNNQSSKNSEKITNAYCIECNKGYYLNSKWTINNFIDEGICTKLNSSILSNCDSDNCLFCTKSGTCLVCSPGFSVNNNNNKLCWKCDGNCLSCPNGSYQCSKCLDTYSLDGNYFKKLNNNIFQIILINREWMPFWRNWMVCCSWGRSTNYYYLLSHILFCFKEE